MFKNLTPVVLMVVMAAPALAFSPKTAVKEATKVVKEAVAMPFQVAEKAASEAQKAVKKVSKTAKAMVK